MASSSDYVFGCQGIQLSLGGRQILDSISIAVKPGEILGLIGPNGAGKTSLFEVLCGRYKASAGEVFIAGEDVSNRSIHGRARLGVARTYQSPVVPNAMSIDEAFRAARFAYAPNKTRFDAEAGARRARFHQPWDMACGALGTFDRRKLLLSSLLMRKPKVLLLDEPASGLINSEIDELDLIIREQADEYGIGVILIEHRLELLSAIADRVAVLDLGQLIAEGKPDDVFGQAKVRQAYLSDAQ